MMKNSLMMAVAVVALAACSPLKSTAPVPLTYALHPDLTTPQTQSQPDGVMFVSRPGLPAGFDTDRIALYMDGGRRIDYYAGARWAEALDIVLQDVLVRAGRHELPNMIIDSPDLNIPAQYKLAVKVNDFAPLYEQGASGLPLLRLSMTFTLVQMPREKVISDFTLQSEMRAGDNTVSAVAAGLEAMLKGVLPRAYANIAEALPVAAAGKGQ